MKHAKHAGARPLARLPAARGDTCPMRLRPHEPPCHALYAHIAPRLLSRKAVRFCGTLMTGPILEGVRARSRQPGRIGTNYACWGVRGGEVSKYGRGQRISRTFISGRTFHFHCQLEVCQRLQITPSATRFPTLPYASRRSPTLPRTPPRCLTFPHAPVRSPALPYARLRSRTRACARDLFITPDTIDTYIFCASFSPGQRTPPFAQPYYGWANGGCRWLGPTDEIKIPDQGLHNKLYVLQVLQTQIRRAEPRGASSACTCTPPPLSLLPSPPAVVDNSSRICALHESREAQRQYKQPAELCKALFAGPS